MAVIGKTISVTELRNATKDMGVTIETATIMYETIVANWIKHLEAGDKVRVAGIGTMEMKVLEAGIARVPGTDREVQVGERRKVRLKSIPKGTAE